jgi:NAD+ synthase (glutamine-hydrolysing)
VDRARSTSRGRRGAGARTPQPHHGTLGASLQGYVEEGLDAEQLVARGLPDDEVWRILRLMDHIEDMRRRSPPGPEVPSRAFRRERRAPTTKRYGG